MEVGQQVLPAVIAFVGVIIGGIINPIMSRLIERSGRVEAKFSQSRVIYPAPVAKSVVDGSLVRPVGRYNPHLLAPSPNVAVVAVDLIVANARAIPVVLISAKMFAQTGNPFFRQSTVVGTFLRPEEGVRVAANDAGPMALWFLVGSGAIERLTASKRVLIKYRLSNSRRLLKASFYMEDILHDLEAIIEGRAIQR